MAQSRVLTRSQDLARDAAQDAAMGAALGLLIVSGVVACNLDMQETMSRSAAPLSSLAALVALAVAEAAMVATLCGMALRRLVGRD